jgi:hypothetical protein
MPLFVCDYCHSVENTALGWYWSRNKSERMLGELYPNGTALCSSCMPAVFMDGSKMSSKPKTESGWHNAFSRNIATKEYIKGHRLENTQGKIDVLNGIPAKIKFEEFQIKPQATLL